MSSLCELCETRRARRACPGIHGQICSVCCGTEREVTVNCPFECDYLQEARRYERLPEPDPDKWPSPDIEVSDDFLVNKARLINVAAYSLLEAALNIPGVVDADVREALASLVRTYRTLISGLYYETLPANPLAAGIHREVRQALENTRRRLRERDGITPYSDGEVLIALVYLQRLLYLYDNERPRGRAFIDVLRRRFQKHLERTSSSPLVVPSSGL